MKSLRDEMFDYAREALEVRDRPDVYDAVVEVLRNWNFYESDAERRFAFNKLQRDSVKNPRHTVNVNGGTTLFNVYQRERCRVPDLLTAYRQEMNKR